MKTRAQQLGVTEFPFTITDSNDNEIYYEDSTGYWSKSEYDSKGNKIYYETSNGYFRKSEYDSNGNEIYSEIYTEDSDDEDEEQQNMNELSNEDSPEEVKGRVIYGENLNGDRYKMEIDSEDNQMIQKVESLEESLYRLIRDDVVVEQSRYIDECTDDEVMEIVLNGGILTDEYYSELMDVLNVINKQCGMHFTVTVKYEYE